ncbi:MAG: RNA polymerase sigma factor [Candidatus Omnitrophota bacterium]
MNDISRNIIIRASEGDIDAFEEIYRGYSGFVYNVALRVISDKQYAEEVTQDVFLTIYKKLLDFNFKASFKTWVYRIAVNTSINYAKKNQKHRNRTVEFDEKAFLVQEKGGVKEDIEREYDKKIIDRLLGFLSPEQRVCIVLRHIEEMSYEEISQVLDVNINTVRTRLKRAREKLLSLDKEVKKDEL